MTINDFMLLISSRIATLNTLYASVSQPFAPQFGDYSEIIIGVPGYKETLKFKLDFSGVAVFISFASGDQVPLENLVISITDPSISTPLATLLQQLGVVHEITFGMKMQMPMSLVIYDYSLNTLTGYDLNNSSIQIWNITFIAPPPPII